MGKSHTSNTNETKRTRGDNQKKDSNPKRKYLRILHITPHIQHYIQYPLKPIYTPEKRDNLVGAHV